ncbi:hypothetical protein CNBG4060 [Cryptococcus deneoformans B-3501A]|uniref:hypothetical protein n=1 Tax=Cryptococcus deneoformans (strain B-3501A) TaxID=283643 RepID=UPI000042FF60|nr:hypothetical protein CNBG4060 [Cryptococcus neoformans var. neoformans B-3501A]EAL19459.1 hypothetical protein CNBG4060 [Cryptococcus neoformans var. neoformans B-3501A]
MAFPDSADSVHSLLALLRSTQDDPSESQSQAFTSTSASRPGPNSITQNLSSRPIPSGAQLADLLTSLNARPPPRQPKIDSPGRRELIEPFGPVGLAGLSRSPSGRQEDGQRAYERDYGREVEEHYSGSRETEWQPQKPQPKERIREPGYGDMTFMRALPIITELLDDHNFKAELRKMKQDQDALERRLWAKGEKVKADHERTVKAEKDIAKIARQSITSEKVRQWNKTLANNLDAFYRQQCLPAIDGLAVRQRQRLKDLGVPGLGEDGGSGVSDEKVRQRIKRILEVLEAGLEE